MDRTATLMVEYLAPSDAALWDTYVDGHPLSTPFHRTAWANAVEQAFNRRVYMVYVTRAGRICGVLPLTHIKSRIFGSSLISCGFAVYGGPLADDQDAHDALDEEASRLMKTLDVPVVEYRNQEVLRPNWPSKSDVYATFKKVIDGNSDVNLKAIPRKQRAMVRKGIKYGLKARVEDNGDAHFHLYATSLRNLGTPTFPKKFFDALRQGFGANCDILTISHDGQDLCSVLSFYHKGEVLPYFGGGVLEAKHYAANDFMYWSLMEHARDRGCHSFDFGRSKTGTGAFAFKKNWGFEPRALHYEYMLEEGYSVPNINPLNPKYRLMVAAWKKLPLAVANKLGPFINRSLG